MPKPYPPQFRRQALDLVASGRSVRDVAAARRVVPASMEAAGLVVDRGVKPVGCQYAAMPVTWALLEALPTAKF
jgi:hypothetical protein